MDHDSERDESITEARIAGESARAVARRHRISSSDVEAAVDRRLDYAVDNSLRLRLVKLNIERIEALMKPFFERAVKDKDCAAGLLCCKLAERLSLLLGLDVPVQSRVDVYAYQAEQQQPPSFERIHEMIMRIGRQKDGNGADGDDAVGAMSDSGYDGPSH